MCRADFHCDCPADEDTLLLLYASKFIKLSPGSIHQNVSSGPKVMHGHMRPKHELFTPLSIRMLLCTSSLEL